jgi:carbonic anhydrase/acetyltransferase-like protein (isoleucine patch superfamily)
VVGHLAHLEGCTVGDRCLIGSNSVVLNRVVIGDGSLVGAGALVAEGTEVPADSRALGIPARVRDGAGIAAQIDYAVPMYVENARVYRERLVRVG